MFLNSHETEKSTVGNFIILFDCDDLKQLRCVVKRIRLRDNKGIASLDEFQIAVSGDFGNEGMPITVPNTDLWEKLHVVPDVVAEIYWTAKKKEAAVAAISQWAVERMATLSKLR